MNRSPRPSPQSHRRTAPGWLLVPAFLMVLFAVLLGACGTEGPAVEIGQGGSTPTTAPETTTTTESNVECLAGSDATAGLHPVAGRPTCDIPDPCSYPSLAGCRVPRCSDGDTDGCYPPPCEGGGAHGLTGCSVPPCGSGGGSTPLVGCDIEPCSVPGCGSTTTTTPPGPPCTGSACEDGYTDRLIDSMEDEVDDEDIAIERPEIECLAGEWVNTLGADTFTRAGVDPDGTGEVALDGVLDTSDYKQLAPAFERCGVDTLDLLVDSVDSTGDPDLEACLRTVPVEPLDRLLAGGFLQEDESDIADDPEASMMIDAMVECMGDSGQIDSDTDGDHVDTDTHDEPDGTSQGVDWS